MWSLHPPRADAGAPPATEAVPLQVPSSRPSTAASADAPPATEAMPLQVCPPRPFGDNRPLVKRLWDSMAGAEPPGPQQALEQLKGVREEFSQVLDDLDGQSVHFLQHRLLHCRSMRELWHLRSEIFNLVACRLSQQEAERRLNALNRHFPTRSPRSGFVPPDF